MILSAYTRNGLLNYANKVINERSQLLGASREPREDWLINTFTYRGATET